VAAGAQAPQAGAQAATIVAALRMSAVTRVLDVLLGLLVDRMWPPSIVENHEVVAV